MAIVLFVLNPGSTSTKTALFRDGQELFGQTCRHDPDSLLNSESMADQLNLRLRAVEEDLAAALSLNRLELSSLTAIVGRGGLLRGIESGVYQVSPDMLLDLEAARYGEHASNFGALIASRLADRLGLRAYIADPPCVDELDDLARVTGLPAVRRRSLFHALNQKAMARKAAGQLDKPYDQCRLIVAHLGGGISVGAHRFGRVVDVNNALEEGPFSPERSGTLPSLQLVDLCFSGKYDRQAVRRLINGRGGLMAHAGTTDFRLIEEQASFRPELKLVIEAMAYQIAKEIAAMTVALEGRADAIILTGGLARSRWLTGEIARRIESLGKLLIFPGEDEMAALDSAVRRMFAGHEQCREYRRQPDDQIGGSQI